MMFNGFPSPATPLLKAIWAPGFLLCAVACYVLRDASDRGRLGASTFKNLNLGAWGPKAGREEGRHPPGRAVGRARWPP